MKFNQNRKLTSLLGLALDGSRIEGVLLRRTNGSLQVQEAFSVVLTLDPLTADPELVGRELRNHLDAVGIRERNCVVGLPLRWVLTAQVELPDLAEPDRASFLQLEAERVFPCDAATLCVATSRFQALGKDHALLAGIPRIHVEALERSLRAARLHPLSFTLAAGCSGMLRQEALSMLIGETNLGLQVAFGGGIAALRSIESAYSNEAGTVRLETDQVTREVRVTLGQLPPGLRERIRRVRIFGTRDRAQQLADELELRLDPAEVQVEVVNHYEANEFGLKLPPDTLVSPPLSLAADRVAGRIPVLEFLPPRIGRLRKMADRYASGRLRAAGAVALGALALFCLLFLYQQWQLVSLHRQWKQMAARVQELAAVQDQVRQYRPWFEDTLRGMNIMRELTKAFPEDGVVSAKTVEIRDGRIVTCTGVARDNASWLSTLDRLRTIEGVADLKVDQVRGKSPMQFTFNFHWNPGGPQ